jgi:membrane-associated HD superfamily phosphohydrolase
MTKVSTSKDGIGFCGLLTILFIGLKLTRYINWSWWWVLTPLWLPFMAAITVMVLVLSFAGLSWILAKIFIKMTEK